MQVVIAETEIHLKGLKNYSLGNKKLPVLDLLPYNSKGLAIIVYNKRNKYLIDSLTPCCAQGSRQAKVEDLIVYIRSFTLSESVKTLLVGKDEVEQEGGETNKQIAVDNKGKFGIESNLTPAHTPEYALEGTKFRVEEEKKEGDSPFGVNINSMGQGLQDFNKYLIYKGEAYVLSEYIENDPRMVSSPSPLVVADLEGPQIVNTSVSSLPSVSSVSIDGEYRNITNSIKSSNAPDIISDIRNILNKLDILEIVKKNTSFIPDDQ